jgi:hypothetical protein
MHRAFLTYEVSTYNKLTTIKHWNLEIKTQNQMPHMWYLTSDIFSTLQIYFLVRISASIQLSDMTPLNSVITILSSWNVFTNIIWTLIVFFFLGTRGRIVGWAKRSRVRVPMRWIFFSLPNPSSRTMPLESTQPLMEMSTRNLPGG